MEAEEVDTVVDTEGDMVEAEEDTVEDMVDMVVDMGMAKRREKPMPSQRPMLLLSPTPITAMEDMVAVTEGMVVAMEDTDMAVNVDPLSLDMDTEAMVDMDMEAMVVMGMVDMVITDKP